MEQDFLKSRLADHGLTVLVPDTDERKDVHRIIYEELVCGRDQRHFTPDVSTGDQIPGRPWRPGDHPWLHAK